jgi:citrate lyase subunit beta/citryl-CoA lyase
MTAAVPRSWLFVPADDERKLARAFQCGADAVILDLEDAVAPARKSEARRLARAFLAGLPPQQPDGPRRYVRINGLDAPGWHDDLDAAVAAGADGIVLPKPRSGDDVHRLAIALDHQEASAGRQGAGTAILAIVTETPHSVLTLASYGGVSTRLRALAWGAEDLSAALGATATRDEAGALTSPFRLVRDLTLIAAASAGAAAVDTVYLDIRDLAGLELEARAAARDGFGGKLAIHPDQVAVINRAFTPSAAQIAEAERIVALFGAAGESGVVTLDGRMLDRPHLTRAERVLERARRPGRETRA